MPENKTLSYLVLEEPLDPDRQESLMERMEDLVDSIRSIGLRQPITVEDLENGSFRVWAGHRRSIACTILQITDIPAIVYPKAHPDLEKVKHHENSERNPLTVGEECRKYARLWSEKGMGVEQIAAYLGVKMGRVQVLLDIACGDPQVYGLVQEGKLSLAQATNINKIDHGGYRLQAIELATVHEFGGEAIRKWYQEEKRKSVVAGVPDATVPGLVAIPVQYDVGSDLCNLGGEQTPLLESRLYRICNDHYNVVLKGLERVGQLYQIEQAGLLPDYMALVRRAERLMNDGRDTLDS